MLNELPSDVLYKIFVHLEVIDLVRIQRVSKRFFQTTQHRAVWSDAYESTDLPRPPGPFAWQSVTELRSTLITSAKVDRVWPPHSTSRIFSREIQLTPDETKFRLIFGRWLFVASAPSVRCFDLDIKEEGAYWMRIVYRVSHDDSMISSFSCVDVATPDGPLAFAVCVEKFSTPGPEYVVKVFRVVIFAGSSIFFDLVQEIGIDSPHLHRVHISPRGLLIQARGRVVDRHSRIWVMNLETYKLYRLNPPLIDGRQSWHIAGVCLGTTHLLLIHGPAAPLINRPSYAEAYALPTAEAAAGSDSGTLEVTHRSDCAHILPIRPWKTFHSATRASHITFLTAPMARQGRQCFLARFTLPPRGSSSEGLSPIHLETQMISGFGPVSTRARGVRMQPFASTSQHGNRRVFVEDLYEVDGEEKIVVRGLTLSADDSLDALRVDGMVSVQNGLKFTTARRRWDTLDVVPDGVENPTRLLFDGDKRVVCFDEARGRMCVREKLGDGGIVLHVVDLV